MSGDKALVLRVCAADGSSSHGFVWPRAGAVEAPDWDPEPTCGRGLHGWLWGAGSITAAGVVACDPLALWLVVEVLAAEVVDLRGKVKFRRGEVVLAGTRDEAIALVSARAPAGTAIMFGRAIAGYRGTATAGYRGTATAGYRGTAIAGDSGTATAGDSGTAIAGYSGTATAGYRGGISIGWWDEQRQIMRTASAEMALDELDTEGLTPGRRYRVVVVDGRPQFDAVEDIAAGLAFARAAVDPEELSP